MLYSIIVAGALVSALLTVAMSVAVIIMSLRAERLPRGTTPISVLKPVRGLDDEFEANLESFCLQTHSAYEILVGSADPADPALEVARRVQRRFPNVALRIVSGEWPTGHNPKVRNLRHLVTKARYPTVLVSDGDVRVGSDYLSVMAGAIEQPNVGLVSNFVVGTGERTLGAACENVRLNGFVVRSLAAAQLYLRHPVIMGKAMLFRRDALTNAGGFAAAADVLAEDYLLGRAVLEAGYRVQTLGYPVFAMNRDWTVAKMLQRHTRWSQIRRHVAPGWFLLEPLAAPELWALLALVTWWFDPHRIDAAAGTWVATALALSVLLEAGVASLLQGTRIIWKSIALLPLSSALALLAWLCAWHRDAVVWRQQSFRIGAGSRLSAFQAQRPASAHKQRLPEAA